MGARDGLIRTALVSMLAGASSSACHMGNADPDAQAASIPDADFVSCASESRATPYQPGMQVTSSAGMFVVKLLSNTFTDPMGKVLDEPFAKGVDVWTIEAEAAATTTPVDGLTISVKPWMPDHGHGTTSVGVTPTRGGLYTISPLNLYMAGYWEVTLTIVDSSSGTPVMDTAMLKICVPD
jgi:hypothetical protein